MNFNFFFKTMKSRNLAQLSHTIDSLLPQNDKMAFRKNLKDLEHLKMQIWKLLINKEQTLKYAKQEALKNDIQKDATVLRFYSQKIKMYEKEISTLKYIHAVLDGILTFK